MRLVLHLFVNTLAVLVSAYLLKGVQVNGVMTALVVAIVLGIANVVLKPIFILLTLPITILTFGLFLFVINALLVLLVSEIVPGFAVQNFWWALIYSLVLSLVNSFLNSFV